MDFIKKNWSKLAIATLTGVMAILMLVLMATAPSFDFVTFSGIFGLFIFFAGTCAHCICKMFKHTKPFAMYVLATVGLLATIFLAIVWFDSFSGYKGLSAIPAAYRSSARWVANFGMFLPFAYLVAFGLIPLINGVKKIVCHFFCKECCEEKKTPATTAPVAKK